MTLRQTLLSEPLLYRDHDDLPPYTGLGPYNTELVESPRHYRDEVNWISGLFSRKDATAMGDYTISAVAVMNTYEWPGWRVRQYRWDAATGEYIDQTDRSAFGITLSAIKAGADDSLWAQYPSDTIYLVDSYTWELTSTSYAAAYWGATTVPAYAIDRARDIAVLRTNLEPFYEIGVYRLSTGENIGRMDVSGQVQDIFIEDSGRAYVLATNGVLTLIDYLNMNVLGVARQQNYAGSRSTKFAWDRQYRRILAIDATPEETDGASTTRIRGYYPAPAPVALTSPIPIKTPRAGRVVPVITRAYGDTGEPVAGARIDAVSSDALIAGVAPVISSADGYGYARHMMTCNDGGSIDFDVSADA